MKDYINRALRIVYATIGIGALAFTSYAGTNGNVISTPPTVRCQSSAEHPSDTRKYPKLSELPNPYPEETAIYLPLNGKHTLEEAIAEGIGILDEKLVGEIRKEITSENHLAGKKPKPEKGKKGIICHVKTKIPAHYHADDVRMDPETLEAKEFPKIELEGVLNIPAFRWRIYHREGDKSYLMVDWPVIAGNPFGGKGYDATPTGKYKIYALVHFPSYDEGYYNRKAKKWVITKHVDPGARSNPFQEWQFRYYPDPHKHFYFHGTNRENLLKSKNRMRSHGCVRNYNYNADSFATVALRNEDLLDVIDSICGHRAGQDWNTAYKLKHPIPQMNIYDTIEVFSPEAKPLERGYVEFYPNKYKLTAKQDNASDLISLTTLPHLQHDLEAAGYDLSIMDPKKLEAIIKNRETSATNKKCA